MNTKKRLLLGAHMSIADGFDTACLAASAIGCTTMQIFTKSNRQWKAKVLTTQEISSFKQTQQDTGITPVVAHASYLINIGSIDTKILHSSKQALLLELERCTALGIPYLVLHPGSYVTGSQQECLAQIADVLDEILAVHHKGAPMILLETMAGQGTTVGKTFEQLAWIQKKITHQERLGVCLDTCHLFAAGYPLHTEKDYYETLQIYDDVLGIQSIKTIHLNDSKKPCGSHIDRHEHLGKGTLGKDIFRLILNDPRLFDIPKILETPIDNEGNHARNICYALSLLSQETRLLLDK